MKARLPPESRKQRSCSVWSFCEERGCPGLQELARWFGGSCHRRRHHNVGAAATFGRRETRSRPGRARGPEPGAPASPLAPFRPHLCRGPRCPAPPRRVPPELAAHAEALPAAKRSPEPRARRTRPVRTAGRRGGDRTRRAGGLGPAGGKGRFRLQGLASASDLCPRRGVLSARRGPRHPAPSRGLGGWGGGGGAPRGRGRRAAAGLRGTRVPPPPGSARAALAWGGRARRSLARPVPEASDWLLRAASRRGRREGPAFRRLSPNQNPATSHENRTPGS